MSDMAAHFLFSMALTVPTVAFVDLIAVRMEASGRRRVWIDVPLFWGLLNLVGWLSTQWYW